jgi:hypothetical protein
MTTYFGYPSSGADPTGATEDGNADITIRNNVYTTGFTCPGSGNMTIDEISAWVNARGGAGNIRLAIYSESNILVAQGTAQVAVSGSSPSWQGHMSSGSITGGPLVAGTIYRIAYTKDNDPNLTYEYFISGTLEDFDYKETDYTDGFISEIPTPMSNTAGRYCMRCGVSSPSSIEQEGFRFRNDDGDEDGATWKADQDTNITLAADTAARIRMLLNATGDPSSIGAQLEYRYKPSGGAFGSWTKVN